ncbi:MAG: Bax inhibitor-1/YccA family protein [Bacteroidota bacterium]|nr:Bax inhibitor-1/YccA family protein [Bacteroidota bacterium]
MYTTNPNNLNPEQWNSSGVSAEGTAIRTFMRNVFGWMFGALVITALTSYAFGNIPELMELLYKFKGGRIVGFQVLGTVLIFAPFILVLVMNIAYNKLSFFALVGFFILFSLVFGVSISTIFIRYSMPTIGASFAIAAGMFGTMAIMGFTTKADLTNFGGMLKMALFGLVIAIIVNIFMRSDMMQYVISLAGVAIFTGLTAYDVQKLKQIGGGITYGTESAAKLSIMGALTLYLDFINIFLFLLRLMGGGSRK